MKRNSNKLSALSSCSRLVKLVKPYKAQFCLGLLALLVGSATNLVFPEVVRRILEPSVLRACIGNLHLVMLGLGLLFLLQGVAFFSRSYLFSTVGQRVFRDVREQLFRAIISKDVLFFDRHRSGDLASRINSDAALVQEAVSTKFSVILRYGVQVILGVILMLWMSWRMTLAIVTSVAAMLVFSTMFIKRLKAASGEYQGALARLSAFASECFAGAKVVRSLAAQGDASAQFSTINGEVLSCGERRIEIAALFSSGASAVLNLLLLAVLWFGIHLVLQGDLPLNALVAFVLYGTIVAVSFSFLISAYTELMQSLGGLERVFELIDRPGVPDGLGEIQRTQILQGPVSLEIENLTFAYPLRPEMTVLQGVNLLIRPGKTTALVGPSGSGKSSVVQLLLDFYRPTAGEILANGKVLSSLDESSIRDCVAWVPQEPQLFCFTIYENLVFGNSGSSRQQLLELLPQWRFLDFVEALPQGMDTLLGEGGAQLSGGQRQRIAIARALLRKPAVLILDEATSGLDSDTEVQVLEAVRTWLPHSAVLLISHRLATVQRADITYVIHNGEIRQYGTHEELRGVEGLYKQYVERQTLQ
jgi:ATP-binding cassette subfamily B protein